MINGVLTPPLPFNSSFHFMSMISKHRAKFENVLLYPTNIFSCNFSFYFKLALVDANLMGLYYRVQMTPFHIYIIMLGLRIIKTNFVKSVHLYHYRLYKKITIKNIFFMNKSPLLIMNHKFSLHIPLLNHFSLHLQLVLWFISILTWFVLLHISFMDIQCYKSHMFERLSIWFGILNFSSFFELLFKLYLWHLVIMPWFWEDIVFWEAFKVEIWIQLKLVAPSGGVNNYVMMEGQLIVVAYAMCKLKNFKYKIVCKLNRKLFMFIFLLLNENVKDSFASMNFLSH